VASDEVRREKQIPRCARHDRGRSPGQAGLGNEGDFALFFASGLHGDLDVLAEGGEEVHEALDGKGAGAVAHQGGNVRLLDAEDLAGIGLLEAALFDEAVNLQRKLGFQEFLFGMGEAEVGKNVSAAFFHPDWFSRPGSHVSSPFLCGGAPPRPGGDV
jgi:hypothetical protein